MSETKCDKSTHSYIGRKPDCGCVVVICADMGDKFTANSVRDMINDGLIVERVSHREAVELLQANGCPHTPRQRGLL